MSFLTLTRDQSFSSVFSRASYHTTEDNKRGRSKNPSTEYGATKRPWSYPISLFVNTIIMNTGAPSNAIESYCTFTLAPDVTAGGLPSEDEIAKDLESTDDSVSSTSPLENDSLGRGMREPICLFVCQLIVACIVIFLIFDFLLVTCYAYFIIIIRLTGQKTRPQGSHYGHAFGRIHASYSHASNSILHQLERQATQKVVHVVLGSCTQVPGTVC